MKWGQLADSTYVHITEFKVKEEARESKNRKVLQQNRIRVERLSGWINVKDVCYRLVSMSGLYLGPCRGREPLSDLKDDHNDL